jgi:hypothetical protein
MIATTELQYARLLRRQPDEDYYGGSPFNGGERILESRQRLMFLEFGRDNNSNR